MEAIFAAAAGSFMIMLLVALTIAMRRGTRIQEILSELSEQKKKLAESEDRYRSKCRQTDDSLTRLSQAKDEINKAKRKIYLLEQKEKQPESTGESDASRLQQQALEEAHSQSRQYLKELNRIKEERDRMQDQLGKLKKELTESKSLLQSLKDSSNFDRQKHVERIKELEEHTSALDKKLQSAKRKARIDSQVYKVTKNKLELAMEKIAYLEKQIKANRDAQTSEDNFIKQPHGTLSESKTLDARDQVEAQEDKVEVGN